MTDLTIFTRCQVLVTPILPVLPNFSCRGMTQLSSIWTAPCVPMSNARVQSSSASPPALLPSLSRSLLLSLTSSLTFHLFLSSSFSPGPGSAWPRKEHHLEHRCSSRAQGEETAILARSAPPKAQHSADLQLLLLTFKLRSIPAS